MRSSGRPREPRVHQLDVRLGPLAEPREVRIPRVVHLVLIDEDRIVELQIEARVDDRAIFLAHRFGDGDLLRFEVRVVRALEHRDTTHDGGHEASSRAVPGDRRLEVRDVALDQCVAGVLDGTDCDRKVRRLDGFTDMHLRRAVVLGEVVAILAVAEDRGEQVRLRRQRPRFETRHALVDVRRPGTVVDRVHRGLAVLAVVDDVEAHRTLLAHDVVDALRQHRRDLRVRSAAAIQREQRFGTRQAADVRREDAIGHRAHSTAEKMMSAIFWKRRVLALCSITPAERQVKVMSRTGSIQNSVVPAP